MAKSATNPKRKWTTGQKTGLGIILVSVGVPAFFWAIALWRDLTRTYCEGECATGWMAVITTMLAIPSLAIGIAVLGISTALKSGRENNS